ncbi:group II intron maturase-specific domain-containing protein [Hoeflea sp.]|uniref:group II intron maturase-specific domain-containing protein n=1 Tax=Hoeflea sp. TaxID=1940281 RepID=UPI003B0261DB
MGVSSYDKTRCLRCPDEALEFLGYRIGCNYRPKGKGIYIGTRPSRASIQNICRKISDQTAAKYGLMTSQDMVRRLNRMISGWANYYHLGQVSPAYAVIDAHATKRLRQWFCRKHKVRNGKYVRYSNQQLWEDHNLRAGFKSYSNVTIPCETPRHEPDACYERPRG